MNQGADSHSTANAKTDFGYKQVPESEKAGLVGEVFSSVAPHYDLMNDVMSMGIHRLWKRFAVSMSGVRAGHRVLDVAGGSGDLTVQFAKRVGKSGKVILTDINAAMLDQGRRRIIDSGMVSNVEFALADAMNLNFDKNYFNCVAIAFGLRNVTDKKKALAGMARVLAPAGRAIILEFSQPTNLCGLNNIYDWYSFKMIPFLGELIARDRASYQYLVESIRKHPDQETLKQMMLESGFDEVQVYNLSGGIVALHVGFKY